jgi:dTDP-4-dehydrorhamnose reductase
MLGSDLLAELQARKVLVRGFNRLQCDVTNAAQCRAVIAAEKPVAVINCAAYTNVDGAETDAEAAFAINAAGAANVATAAAAVNAHCYYVSSDYVFDGLKAEPYAEEDAPAPLGVYGLSKLQGEHATATHSHDSHCIVRTSWLYGNNGRNFVTTMLGLARRGEALRVVDDQHGAPTSTLALARCIADLIRISPEGILHATCAADCTWYDFAGAIFEISGVHPHSIQPVKSSEFPRPAPRPANSRLACNRLAQLGVSALPHWRDALREYIASLQLERC